ncbi:hypothetical protein [Streptomyces sp. NPDC001741]|uniref:hypothetical protein n=1 Tax=unclassified Streptomyces TaxID=2593676 RepID=UPI0036C54D6A
MRRKVHVTDAAFTTPEMGRFADAVRGGAEPEGVDRALTAFREALGATDGSGPRRPRPRDDWRPVRDRRWARVPLRAALGAAVAGVTLGGVALAAGTGMLPGPAGTDGPERRPTRPPGVDAPRTPSATRPDGAPGSTGPGPSSPVPPEPGTRDAPAPDQVALCRARGKGNGPNQGAAFRRLVEAAGGASAVDAYCATVDVPAPTGPPSAAPGRSKEQQAAPPARGRSGKTAGVGKGR